MAARLGVVARLGLGEALRRRFDRPEQRLPRLLAIALVAGAIGLGNAAYQTGNLLGASLGAQAAGGGPLRLWITIVAAGAALLLAIGRYRAIERTMVGLVLAMSAAFLVTALTVAGDLPAILRGAIVPTLPGDATLVALGLIGTTIVPYNLFLHASAARERFETPERLPEARADLGVAIGLGGIVSMAIVVTAAARVGAPIANATDMAAQLEPLLGRWATATFSVGLFAAGLTSAITAPLAAAYAVGGALGWTDDLRSARMRAVWLLVLATGYGFAMAGVRPLPAIVFAQAANGILLPAVTFFLLLVMNDRRTLGAAANGWRANLLGTAILLLTLLLGGRALLGALG